MKKYIKDAYEKSIYIFNNGFEYEFYTRFDRKPTRIILALDTENLEYALENNKKYMNRDEFNELWTWMNRDKKPWGYDEMPSKEEQFKISNIKNYTYLAVFEPSKTGYGVYFPDLVGCISYGDTFEQAQENAKEALELHIKGILHDREEVPKPKNKPTIYPETENGYIIYPVTIELN